MSILFLTDLHLDQYRPYSTILKNGMNSRLYDQMMVVQKIKQLVDKIQPTATIFMGDLFNGITESLPKIIYNAGFLTAQAWSQSTPLYLIVGNHDIYRGMHTFSAFESLPNVRIISKTTKLQLDGLTIDCIPWDNPLPENKGDVCAGHLEVFGTYMNGSYTCKVGLYPKVFDGYKYVLLGHFHAPSEFPVPGAKEARYIGSLMQCDRRRPPEGFMGVVELTDDTLIGHPIESPKIYDVIINTQEEFATFLPQVEDGNYYKVVVKSQDVVVPRLSYRVSVEYDLPEIISSRLNINRNPEESWDTKLQEAVTEYIKKANTKLDKDKLIQMAKELL